MNVTSLPLPFPPVLFNILKRIITPGFKEHVREFTGFLLRVPEDPMLTAGLLHSIASCAGFPLLWCHGLDHISREISLVWKYSVSFMLSDYQLSRVKKDRDQDRCLTFSSPGRAGLVCIVYWFPWCKCSSTTANFSHQFVRVSVSWL